MIKEREFVEDPLFIGMEACKKKKFDGSTCRIGGLSIQIV